METAQVLELHQNIKDSYNNEVEVLENKIKSNSLASELIAEIEQLRNIGFENYDYSRVLRGIEEDKLYLKSLKKTKKSFKGFDIITLDALNAICKKHNLTFKEISEYTSDVPSETIVKYNKFKSHVLKNGISDLVLKRLYVVAPKSKFDEKAKNIKNEDPILISDVHYRGFFAVIHSWGFEKSILKNLK